MSQAQPQPESNYRFRVAYDGRDFYGWQRLRDKPTIQGALERAITQVLGVRAAVHGSGRTDRGAHALAQVASVRLPARPEAELDALAAELDAALPGAITLSDLRPAPDDFHACDSALAKQYLYLIWAGRALPAAREARVWHVREPLDAEAMAAACPLFVGTRDFASFAKPPRHQQSSTLRTVSRFTLERDGPELRLRIRADGFLYKMVRNIVRAVAKVGEGRTTLAQLEQIIAACDRKAAPGTAPASGLYLERVFYPDEQNQKL